MQASIENGANHSELEGLAALYEQFFSQKPTNEMGHTRLNDRSSLRQPSVYISVPTYATYGIGNAKAEKAE